jgi:hypothetical protein
MWLAAGICESGRNFAFSYECGSGPPIPGRHATSKVRAGKISARSRDFTAPLKLSPRPCKPRPPADRLGCNLPRNSHYRFGTYRRPSSSPSSLPILPATA